MRLPHPLPGQSGSNNTGSAAGAGYIGSNSAYNGLQTANCKHNCKHNYDHDNKNSNSNDKRNLNTQKNRTSTITSATTTTTARTNTIRTVATTANNFVQREQFHGLCLLPSLLLRL